jgi:hypothetical protein
MGSEAQTFVERRMEFLVLADIYATGRFIEIERLALTLLPGQWTECAILIPSQALPGEPIPVAVRLTDRWGNPCSGGPPRLEVLPNPDWASLPSSIAVAASNEGTSLHDFLAPRRPGTYRVEVLDPESARRFTSNPLVVSNDAAHRPLFWGDLHGQSGETLGTGTVDEYLHFARHSALLDFVGHQGNCFEMNGSAWDEICRALAATNQEGAFVTFLGYEWSATTSGGGDRNVYFLDDAAAELHRSGAWALDEPTDDPGTFPVESLHERFTGREDVLLVPHVGGRYAELRTHDDTLEPVVEICSAHGHFEWLYLDALRGRYKVGVVGGSDDHTGRPGASHPRRGTYGVLGGLTAVYADAKTRTHIWDAIRHRRCYATSGERILLHVACGQAETGDTVQVESTATISSTVSGTAPVERIELWMNDRRHATHATQASASPPRLRVRWGGARRRGRGRATVWDGHIELDSGRITGVEPYSFDSPAEGVTEVTTTMVRWKSITSGDDDGIVVEFDDFEDARLRFRSPFLDCALDLVSLGSEPVTHELGGQDMHVTFERLPEPLGLDVRHEFRFEAPTELTAVWIKVVQANGHKAWSSPIWFLPGDADGSGRTRQGATRR